MSTSKLAAGFVYFGEVVSPEGIVTQRGIDLNLVPQVGINLVASWIMGTGSIVSNWYVGVGEGDYVPTSDITSADLPGTLVECTAYSQTTRPVWVPTYDGVSQLSSITSRAEYTFTSTKRLYTAFLCGSATKGGNSGPLLSAARLATPYDVPAGSTFRLGAVLTLLSL